MSRHREHSTPSCWTTEYSLRNCEGYAVAFPFDSVEAVDPAAERVYVSLTPAAPNEQLLVPALA